MIFFNHMPKNGLIFLQGFWTASGLTKLIVYAGLSQAGKGGTLSPPSPAALPNFQTLRRP